MTEKIRIGVIGAGIMGQQYIRIYQDHPYATVVAVAARHRERAQDVADRYGVPRATDDWHTITDTGDPSATPPGHVFSIPINTNQLFMRLTVTAQ